MKTSPFNTMTSCPRIKRRKVSVKLWPPRPTSSNIVGRNNVGRCWTGGPNGSNIIQHDIRQYRNLPKSLSCARALAQQCWTWWPSGPIQHESKENVGQCWTECLTGFKHHPTSPIQHGGQTSPTCCAEQCWMAMLGSFGQGLRCSPVLRRLSLKLSHALMASSLDSFDRVYYLAYEHASHSKPRSVYNSIVQPLFVYADTVWGELSDDCSQELWRLQNRAARIILKRNTSKDSFGLLNWVNLSLHAQENAQMYFSI